MRTSSRRDLGRAGLSVRYVDRFHVPRTREHNLVAEPMDPAARHLRAQLDVLFRGRARVAPTGEPWARPAVLLSTPSDPGVWLRIAAEAYLAFRSHVLSLGEVCRQSGWLSGRPPRTKRVLQLVLFGMRVKARAPDWHQAELVVALTASVLDLNHGPGGLRESCGRRLHRRIDAKRSFVSSSYGANSHARRLRHAGVRVSRRLNGR